MSIQLSSPSFVFDKVLIANLGYEIEFACVYNFKISFISAIYSYDYKRFCIKVAQVSQAYNIWHKMMTEMSEDVRNGNIRFNTA
jgi:hypothetical protein